MRTVIDILTSVNPNIEGILYIYNLFNLCNTNDLLAIKQYEALQNEKLYEKLLCTDFRNINFKESPWIWFAWGVKSNRSLLDRKRAIRDMVPKGKKVYALYPPNYQFIKPSIHTYHPSPHNRKSKETYKQEMIKLMNQIGI